MGAAGTQKTVGVAEVVYTTTQSPVFGKEVQCPDGRLRESVVNGLFGNETQT